MSSDFFQFQFQIGCVVLALDMVFKCWVGVELGFSEIGEGSMGWNM